MKLKAINKTGPKIDSPILCDCEIDGQPVADTVADYINPGSVVAIVADVVLVDDERVVRSLIYMMSNPVPIPVKYHPSVVAQYLFDAKEGEKQ